MRKISVLQFISLDGVIQSPGSPEEDPSNGFELGGWVAPYDDEISGKLMEKLLEPKDLLLGRKTFEIWENYWPKHADFWPGINEVSKFTLSKTRTISDWENSYFLSDIEAISQLKSTEGSDLQVWGSSQLVQLLLRYGMVDELWLMIHPVILGSGKKLFAEDALPNALNLVSSTVNSKGVIYAHYRKAGSIQTGTIGAS
jgi:dihydrofolate reductase